MVLPYTQVKYIFGTSAVSPALATYYGCIFGKATKLHDLATHGWFTPAEGDCGGSGATADFNGRTFLDAPITINPEGTDGALPYPSYTKGNTVLIPTIKTYYRNLKTVSMFAADSDVCDKWLAVPVNQSTFRILRDVREFPTGSTEEFNASNFFTVDAEKGTLSVASNGSTLDHPEKSLMMVPGRLAIKLKTQTGTETQTDVYVLIDVKGVDGKPMNQGVKAIDGRLHLYKKVGTGTDTKYVFVDKGLSSYISYSFDPESKTFVFKGTAKIKNSGTDAVKILGCTLDTYTVGSYGPEQGVNDPFLGNRTASENGQDMFFVGPRYHVAAPGAEDAVLASDEYGIGLGTEEGEGISIGTEADPDAPTVWPRYTFNFNDGKIEVEGDEGTTGTKLEDVKTSFLKATSQKTLSPATGGVVVSLGRMDHEGWMVYSNYSVFHSSGDYAPCFGISVCRYSDDKPVRINGIDIDQITGSMILAESTLQFNKWDYVWNGSTSEYLGSYDTDPADSLNRPAIGETCPNGNFISGDFRLEYQESVTSAGRTGENGLYRTDLLGANEDITDYIGQADPRNQLGFAYMLVKELTSSDFYVLACNDLDEGLATMEKYRNIFHVWYVNGEGPVDKFYNWIDKENQKEQSRFRIGYQYKPIADRAKRIYNQNGRLYTDPEAAFPYRYQCDNAQFASKLGVIPGDTLEDKASGKTYKILTVNESTLDMEDEYIPTYQMLATDAGENWVFDYTTVKDTEYYGRDIDPDTCRVKIKYTYAEPTSGGYGPTKVGVFEGSWTDLIEDQSDYFTAEHDDTTMIWTVKPAHPSDPAASDFRVEITDCRFDFRFESYRGLFDIYRVYNTQEKTDRLVGDQTQYNMACVTVLTRNINYDSALYRAINPDDLDAISAFRRSSANMEDYTMLPDYATPGLIFGTKLATQPHMPLTLVSFSIPGIGEVKGMREFSHQNLEELLAAGYCMLNSEVGGLPFCETDCTVGYPKYGDSDRGLLSKITPVLMYGKDVYNVTNDWKGPMNTGTPELVSGLGTALVVLKKRYTDTHYNLLGTLLKSVSDATISFDGSHVIIEHHISSQDPARYIDNTVYVE